MLPFPAAIPCDCHTGMTVVAVEWEKVQGLACWEKSDEIRYVYLSENNSR